mgnify:FL=1
MMSDSKVKRNRAYIAGSGVYKEWKEKVAESVKDNMMSEEAFPPESLVIHRASVIIFDYHDTVYNGHLSADNRNPNDEDLDLFTKIIITILYEYGLVCEFENFDELYNRIKLDLKKRVGESDRYEKRN